MVINSDVRFAIALWLILPRRIIVDYKIKWFCDSSLDTVHSNTRLYFHGIKKISYFLHVIHHERILVSLRNKVTWYGILWVHEVKD